MPSLKDSTLWALCKNFIRNWFWSLFHLLNNSRQLVFGIGIWALFPLGTNFGRSIVFTVESPQSRKMPQVGNLLSVTVRFCQGHGRGIAELIGIDKGRSLLLEFPVTLDELVPHDLKCNFPFAFHAFGHKGIRPDELVPR